jgi:hypothetical protein
VLLVFASVRSIAPEERHGDGKEARQRSARTVVGFNRWPPRSISSVLNSTAAKECWCHREVKSLLG